MQNKENCEISWSQFEVCNPNRQVAFENMCRWLFNDFFFAGNAILQSNPNNPGIEVTPKLDSTTNKYISFQAKYFSSMDYSQIEHSAQMTVTYYSGQIDAVYLYCNKDITSTSESYKRIEQYLNDNGIELIPITGQAILEQVMKNETIAWYFFNQISLSQEWFQERLEVNLASLGPKYNQEFNVGTKTEELLNYFLCSEDAVTKINNNKTEIITNLISTRWKYQDYGSLVNAIIEKLEKIDNISEENIKECLLWGDAVKELCGDEFKLISDIIEQKKSEMPHALAQEDRNLANKISEHIDRLSYLLRLPQLIMPELSPRSIMRNQMLVVSGEAGAGKSQMFAVAAKNLVQTGHGAILLLGTNYLNQNSINIQTPEALMVDLSLDAILHKLEGIGAQAGKYSYIFIDALNESTYKSIWCAGLYGLFQKLKKYPHVKMAVSVRTGYEKLVFDEAMLKAISDGDVARVEHNGFREESVSAAQTFLNHYGIPFLPVYFLQSEMTNPLFLTLFCKTYSGDNCDMFSLLEKVISKANNEAIKEIGYSDPLPVLWQLIEEMAEIRLKKGTMSFTQNELFDLNFWNRVGLENKKIPFVKALVHSDFLASVASEYTESYYLGYNLLEDFVCAKTILNKFISKDEIIQYLRDDLLAIKDGRSTKYQNVDIFIIVCGLYAEKHHEDCFLEIEGYISDKVDKYDFDKRYLESFLWRKPSSVDPEAFKNFINSHSLDREDVFRVLIENSTKENHPLNANFLHEILINKDLSTRDYLWTTFVNHLDSDEERLFQLVKYFESGSTLDGLSYANTELLLVLLSWLFTSSNRRLRDKASKAAVEVLKRSFSLCKPLLQRFEAVNDPYVLQRLYGVVFGACVKREQPQRETYAELVKYIFEQIFGQEKVYADILLRDYARLILERWNYENPEYNIFDPSRVIPPYKSDPIPTVSPQEYFNSEISKSGFNRIYMSMKINHAECPGLYGDFGRYTFQSALSDFQNIDIVNLFQYAMQYIRDDLGYSDDLFGEYDCSSLYYYSRQDTRKVERIGKKYQWIAFYNILARISDTHLVVGWDETLHVYEGPWEPYVRDFDPSLNKYAMTLCDVPEINFPLPKNEFLPTDVPANRSDIQNWTRTLPDFFNMVPSKLVVDDDEKNKWIALYLHDSVKNKRLSNNISSHGFTTGSQQIWLIAQAYFVRSSQFETLISQVSSHRFEGLPDASSVYQLFNREYAWASGCQSIFKDEWIDCEFETGKYKIVEEEIEMPDYEHCEYDEKGNLIIPFVKKMFKKRIPEKNVHVQIMSAHSRVLWEEEYDASQEEATAFDIPCQSLIKQLQLEQKQADGYYYTKNGTLACFDGRLTGKCGGFFMRMDLIKEFLSENGLRLFWTCIGEKQYFLGDLNQEWGRWSGIYEFNDFEASGKLELDKP